MSMKKAISRTLVVALFGCCDVASARYVQGDPMGLRGGINPYSYARLSPLLYVDPLGLLVWSGNYHSRGAAAPVGAVVMEFDLRSPCVNNQRGKVHVVAVGPAAGYGVAVSETYGGGIAFEDYLDYVAPTSFNGLFGAVSGAAVVGKREFFSLGKIRLGRAFQIDGGDVEGLDVGLTLVIGSSTVTKVDIECCN